MNNKPIEVSGITSAETQIGIPRFEQLHVRRKAHALVLDLYRATEVLPDSEKFGLASQMRRAAVSVPANIAEGFKRRGGREKVRFYNIAQASLEELRYYCILCRDLNYRVNTENLLLQSEDVGRMLTRLIQSVIGRQG